jgi:hypothetical protein
VIFIGREKKNTEVFDEEILRRDPHEKSGSKREDNVKTDL